MNANVSSGIDLSPVKMKNKYHLWIEKFAIGFFSVLLIFSLYTLISDSFWLTFVSEYNKGLNQIGTILEKSGYSKRRTYIDTLWLPLKMASTIYSGDTLATSSNATLEVEVKPTLKFKMEPDSLIRVRVFDGKPLVRVTEGKIKTHASEQQTIFVKKGTEVKEVEVKQGENPVDTNTNSTETKMSQAPTGKDSEETTPEASTTTIPVSSTTLAKPTTTTIQNTANSSAAIIAKYGKLQLPTPKDGTTFLVNNPGEIVIAAIAICPDRCEMRVSYNGNEYFRRNFQMNEQPIVRIPSNSIQFGDYTWVFTYTDKEIKQSFKIRKFTNESLIESMKSKAPVEVMN